MEVDEPNSVVDPEEIAVRSAVLETAVNFSPSTHPSMEVALSQNIVEFLQERHEYPRDVLARPVVSHPTIDDSLPLSHYFISTSHNTYLLSCQVMGRVDASAYTHVISHTCCCVEIDVWLSADGTPIVTHGWTFSGHISFRDVCIAIGNAVHPDCWPVLISLECHVPLSHQDSIVNIMKEAWGDKLVEKEIEGYEGRESEVSPANLRGRILLLVEYYPPKAVKEEETTVDSSLHDSPPPQERQISPSLAALGVYGRSIKPQGKWLLHELTQPRHILYNISENALGALLPASLQALVANSLSYLRRVYPQGTRVGSSNFVPHKFWAAGTQLAALNWQRYDHGMQLNEAMFVGTGGWVVKPDRLTGMRPFDHRREVRLSCEVFGGCNLPKPEHDIHIYVYAELFLPSGHKTWKSHVRKTSSPIDPSKADFLVSEKFHWDYVEEDPSFIRLSIYHQEFGKDDRLGTFCGKVDYLQQGWLFVRLFNKRGERNGGLLLVNLSYV